MFLCTQIDERKMVEINQSSQRAEVVTTDGTGTVSKLVDNKVLMHTFPHKCGLETFNVQFLEDTISNRLKLRIVSDQLKQYQLNRTR